MNRVRLAQLYREGRGDASAMEEVKVSRQWQELFNVALRYGGPTFICNLVSSQINCWGLCIDDE
mgnify:CR=1 FL=1